MKQDKLWDISPSTGEIMRQVENFEEVKNDKGQTVRWGSLRFSDGTQTEQGFKVTADGEVVTHQFIVPPGGMLGTTDKERVQRGGDENPEDATSTRNYFSGKKTEFRPAGLFNALRSKPVKRAKRKDRTGPKTKAEERQWLADAIAGTAVMPEVKKISDGFPAFPSNLAQLFPGLVKVCTGSSGSQAWNDIATLREDRDEWFKWVASLKDEDRLVIEVARTAGSYVDLAKKGTPRRTAFRQGKARLIAANDNLMAAMNKMAS
ncbi:hypothetical protein ATN81_19035 [Agrobacterium pusense]|nr:hypothetical protein ATN81_19035 [Agrobacterium pusense]